MQLSVVAFLLAVSTSCVTGGVESAESPTANDQAVASQAALEAATPTQISPDWTPLAEGWVTDLTGVLSDGRKRDLSEMLIAHRDVTTAEFAVLLVQDLRGEDIEVFALRVATAWGLGQLASSNGLLMVIALDDRLVRLEVADGLSASIPNSLAKRVIMEDMAPALREARYGDAIQNALTTLMDASR
ncbi:MAG: hypothetical protein ACI8QS_002333 [Planctomycetota bacterium]|jgi:uncharacterized protein